MHDKIEKYRVPGVKGSRIPVNFTRTLESLNPRTLPLKIMKTVDKNPRLMKESTLKGKNRFTTTGALLNSREQRAEAESLTPYT